MDVFMKVVFGRIKRRVMLRKGFRLHLVVNLENRGVLWEEIERLLCRQALQEFLE